MTDVRRGEHHQTETANACAVAWLAWHAPLFVMAGYFTVLDDTPNPFPYVTGIVVTPIFYTVIHTNTSRSVLAVILFHFTQNFVGQVFELAPETRTVQAVGFIIVSGIVLLVWGPRALRRDGTRPRPVTGRSRQQ